MQILCLWKLDSIQKMSPCQVLHTYLKKKNYPCTSCYRKDLTYSNECINIHMLFAFWQEHPVGIEVLIKRHINRRHYVLSFLATHNDNDDDVVSVCDAPKPHVYSCHSVGFIVRPQATPSVNVSVNTCLSDSIFSDPIQWLVLYCSMSEAEWYDMGLACESRLQLKSNALSCSFFLYILNWQ